MDQDRCGHMADRQVSSLPVTDAGAGLLGQLGLWQAGEDGFERGGTGEGDGGA